MEALCELLVLAALLLALVSSASGSVHGCGGFVEASPALAKLRRPGHPKPDYSSTTVELHTIDGLVKDRTHCAPNGYYFLPVYDKGTFLLRVRGPDGWSFERHEVRVIVGQNGCNENEDINFRYTGFSVAGKVLGAVAGPSCSADRTGPAGVSVVLSPAAHDDITENTISTFTSEGGSYAFENLPIGKYRLMASHPTLKVELKGKPETEVVWASTKVDDVFYIPGYTVEGSVVSLGNPVLGVQFYLYPDDTQQLHCPQGSGPPNFSPSLCHATSDANGTFMFADVPCGKYRLVPYYKGENTIFDVSPASVDLSIQHESVVLVDQFQVTGFSVAGRVVNSGGRGVGGATVFIDDVQRGTTDSQGYYKLDQVTSTYYTIRVEKPHYRFSTLQNFLVLPNMAFLPDIYANRFNVCGSVQIDDNVAANHERHVQLTHGSDSENLQVVTVDGEGGFCFEVPEGKYRLSPLTTAEERAAGLLFSPAFHDVIVNAPVHNVSFTQAQVHISGTVECKAQCGSGVSVSLVPLPDSVPASSDREMMWTTLSSFSNNFMFENNRPGRYRLEVKHNPPVGLETLDDDWCWEQKQIDVEVGATDVAGLKFVQKGFWMPIESSHPADAFTLQPHREPVPLQIKKGWQQACLEYPGVHELHFVWPCVYFGALSFPHDTANPQTIKLIGQKYVLSGQIHIDSRLYPLVHERRTSIYVDIKQQDGKVLDLQNRAHLLHEANETDPTAVYEYAYWAHVGDHLTVTPRHERGTPGLNVDEHDEHTSGYGKGLLFYPASQQVSVVADGCQPQIPVFHGRPGVDLRGEVLPALDGVSITIVADGVSSAGSFKKGDVVMRTSTSNDGVFVAGPLFDDTSYSVRAEKAGYHFRPLANSSFVWQRLGQIVVQVVPGQGAESRLPEVLLSLSGDDGYRKNAVTGSDGGLMFDNLFPGSFFLRPFLKEYSFSPSAEAIEVGSGEVKHVKFVARRVAYSVLGTVTSLSGKAAEGVSVGAWSQDGEFNGDTVTDKEGKYRLRGLVPQSSYTVRVMTRTGSGAEVEVERAVPTSARVQVVEEDVMDVDFVVFEHSPSARLSGVVEGQDEVETRRWLPHLSVEVKACAEMGNVQVKRISGTNFYEFGGLGNRKYCVRLISDLPDQTHDFWSDLVEVDMETRQYFRMEPLKFVMKERLEKQELTSAPVLPIVAAVVAATIFGNMSRLRNVFQAIGGSGTATAAKSEAKKTLFRKRTY